MQKFETILKEIEKVNSILSSIDIENLTTEEKLLLEAHLKGLKDIISNFVSVITKINFTELMKFGIDKCEVGDFIFTPVYQEKHQYDYKKIWKTLSELGYGKENFIKGTSISQYVRISKKRK